MTFFCKTLSLPPQTYRMPSVAFPDFGSILVVNVMVCSIHQESKNKRLIHSRTISMCHLRQNKRFPPSKQQSQNNFVIIPSSWRAVAVTLSIQRLSTYNAQPSYIIILPHIIDMTNKDIRLV